jgi:peptidoglycan/xylan/chitin deacetylase (PgdA/CDA1 family)
MVMKQLIADIMKSGLGTIEGLSGGLNYPKDELIVLCIHSTPRNRLKDFTPIIQKLSKKFKALAPSGLKDYFDGKLQDGPYLLYTFDDGLKNNFAAATMLHKEGIHALFFVVPDFIASKEPENYYRKNIRPIVDTSIDSQPEDFAPMGYNELKLLIKDGHSIGCHTMSHCLTAKMHSADIEKEIIASKTILEMNLGVKVESFCSPNHTSFSVNAEAKKLIGSNYGFHFTTYPALHSRMKNPQIIFRRNIEIFWKSGKIKYALGQWDLSRWSKVIDHYQNL